MISRSPRWIAGVFDGTPARRRSKAAGRRRAMAVRRRRRHVGASMRTAPSRANGSRKLPSRSATSKGNPRTRPQDCHSATMSSLALEQNSGSDSAGSPCSSTTAMAVGGSSALPVRRMATPRNAVTANSAPCACRARSGAPRRARDADRRRAGARRPLRPRLRNARARRKGRAAVGSPSRLRDGIPRRGPTRQRSCRLPFDAPNNSAPARLLPPGCRENARARSQSA